MKTEQPELPLKHFPFQEYLGNFKRVRKALAKANDMLTSWKQLPLKLYVKTPVSYTHLTLPTNREV